MNEHLLNENIDFDFDKFKEYYLSDDVEIDLKLPMIKAWSKRGVATFIVSLADDDLTIELKKQALLHKR